MLILNKIYAKNPVSNIRDLVLAVTYQCNSCCQICNIWKSQKTFSCQPSDYENLPCDARNINISGGEPFLRADLPEIIRTIRYRCPKAKIVISTNGFLPSIIKKRMTEIIRFKRDIGVAISLDGFGLVHEELRGVSGGFGLALETIRLLKELNIKDLKIAFTLNDKNINQLKRVYHLSKELDVEFSLAVCHNSSHYFQKENNNISKFDLIKKEISWLVEQELKGFSLRRWARAYFAQGLINFLKSKKRILPDYAGLSSLFIDPFGDIYPSNVWNFKMGKLQGTKNWAQFSDEASGIIPFEKKPSNWMACTVRQAMKEHWIKVGWWILQKKFFKLKNKKGDSILGYPFLGKMFFAGKRS